MAKVELIMEKLTPEQIEAVEDFSKKASLSPDQKIAFAEFLFFTEKLTPEQKISVEDFSIKACLSPEQKIAFAEFSLTRGKLPSGQKISLLEFTQISNLLVVPTETTALPTDRKWKIPDPSRKVLKIIP